MTALCVSVSRGAVPVLLADMKAYMKVTASSDDALITGMLSAATLWGENYTGKDFRANTWDLFLDEFEERIRLPRAPVASITSVQHIVSTVLTALSSTVYYLKKSLQFAEVLLVDGQAWPTNTDVREQAVQVRFVTTAYVDVDLVALAIKQHVAYWYANRGDCGCEQAAQGSGVRGIYDQFRVDRV